MLGAVVWAGVALYRPLWEGAPWAVALALGMPLAMLALNRLVAPPWMRGLGALALGKPPLPLRFCAEPMYPYQT